MSESFAELFEESFASQQIRPGSIITGTVVAVNDDVVIVSAGLKSEAVIPIEQFKNDKRESSIAVGDKIEVALDAVEDGFGETKLSREKAIRARTWIELEKAFEKGEVVEGVINGRVKGGFTVEIDNVRAFLPGSLVDVRPVRDPGYLEGKSLEFKVIKLDQARNNVVVSRRAVVEKEYSAEREALLEGLQEGNTVKGIVKNLTDYGAFVDLGGIDGLVHLSDISWDVPGEEAVRNYKKGQDLEAAVLAIDSERERISLGIKQLEKDPFSAWLAAHPKSSIVKGTVTEVDARGATVDLGEGVIGSLRASELARGRVEDARTMIRVGEEVEAKFINVDRKNRSIVLSIKAKEVHEEAEAISSYKSDASAAPVGTTLGELLKEKMSGESK